MPATVGQKSQEAERFSRDNEVAHPLRGCAHSNKNRSARACRTLPTPTQLSQLLPNAQPQSLECEPKTASPAYPSASCTGPQALQRTRTSECNYAAVNPKQPTPPKSHRTHQQDHPPHPQPRPQSWQSPPSSATAKNSEPRTPRAPHLSAPPAATRNYPSFPGRNPAKTPRPPANSPATPPRKTAPLPRRTAPQPATSNPEQRDPEPTPRGPVKTAANGHASAARTDSAQNPTSQPRTRASTSPDAGPGRHSDQQ